MINRIISFTEKELDYIVEDDFIEFLYENIWEQSLETSYHDYKRIFLDDIFDLPSEVLNDDVQILKNYNQSQESYERNRDTKFYY